MVETAKELGVPAVSTSSREVFQRLNLDPARHYDFATRLIVQEQILDELIKCWSSEDEFISDRTPVDAFAYLLADVNNATSPSLQGRIQDYYERVIASLKMFDRIFLLQPAIPLHYEQGKAALLPCYQENLNYLMLGFLHTNVVPYTVIPKSVTDLADRVDYVILHID